MPRTRRYSVSTETAWFLVLGIAYLFIHKTSFQIGFFDEDFAWLARLGRENFWGFLSPLPGVYYRPLSVNLPYWLFAGSTWAFVIWRGTSLALNFCSAVLLYRLLKQSLEWKEAFALAALWLFMPANLFGIHYFNAFDYVLLPFAIVGFVYALKGERFFTALSFLVLGLGTKEIGSLFFLFAWLEWLLFRRGRKIALWSTAITVAFQLWRLSPGAGPWNSGFPLVHSFWDFLGNFGRLVAGLFYPLGPEGVLEPVTGIWYLFFLITCAYAVVWMIRNPLWKNSGVRKQSFYWLACLALVSLPLLFFQDIALHRSANVFWLFLSLAVAPYFVRALSVPFLMGAVLCLGLVFRSDAELRAEFLRARSQAQIRVIQNARTMMKSCKPGTTVVIEGLVEMFGHMVAEHVFWGALQVKEDGITLKMPLANGDEDKVHPLHRWFYLGQTESSRQPTLVFRRLSSQDGDVATGTKNWEGCRDPNS